MENSKVCNDCKKSLPISKFSGRNAMCKKCRNNKDRKTYLTTKKTLEQKSALSPIENLLIDLSNQFSSSIANHERRETVMKKFSNLSTILDKFLEETEILQFNVEVPEKIKHYLITCEESGIDNNISMIFLRSSQDPMRFEATFQMTQEELQDEITDELEEFLEIIQALRAVYIHWIELKRREFGEKIDKNSFSIDYNPMANMIVATNPLGLSNEEFMTRLDELLQDPPIMVKQYKDWNRYQQFKDMIISDM